MDVLSKFTVKGLMHTVLSGGDKFHSQVSESRRGLSFWKGQHSGGQSVPKARGAATLPWESHSKVPGGVAGPASASSPQATCSSGRSGTQALSLSGTDKHVQACRRETLGCVIRPH